MKYEISVENIKCGGCARTITSKLNALEGVDSIDIDTEKDFALAEKAMMDLHV